MTLDEKLGVPFLLAILALCLGFFMTNAGTYMTVSKFDVLDAAQGDPVVIQYERVIKRDFVARWEVDLYRDGVFVAGADGGPHIYRTTARLPEYIDLEWITDGAPEFFDLPCGHYELTVRWTINPQSVVMQRHVDARDEFQVTCHAS